MKTYGDIQCQRPSAGDEVGLTRSTCNRAGTARVGLWIAAFTLLCTSATVFAQESTSGDAGDALPDSLAGGPVPVGTPSDPAAVAVVEAMIDSLGGRAAFDDTRFVFFKWQNERDGGVLNSRTHYYDRYTGRHRIEGTIRTGAPFIILRQQGTDSLRVWVNGEIVRDPRAIADWRLRGEVIWTNDMYYLFAPFKLRDAGVVLLGAGVELTEDERAVDVVRVLFEEGVGRTPGDEYRLYIDRRTRRLAGWKLKRQNNSNRQLMIARWGEWKRVGPLWLAESRLLVSHADLIIRFPYVVLPESIADAVFDSFEPASVPQGAGDS